MGTSVEHVSAKTITSLNQPNQLTEFTELHWLNVCQHELTQAMLVAYCTPSL